MVHFFQISVKKINLFLVISCRRHQMYFNLFLPSQWPDPPPGSQPGAHEGGRAHHGGRARGGVARAPAEGPARLVVVAVAVVVVGVVVVRRSLGQSMWAKTGIMRDMSFKQYYCRAVPVSAILPLFFQRRPGFKCREDAQ